MYYFESLQTTLQMFADKVQDIWLKLIFNITSDYQEILPSEFLDISTYSNQITVVAFQPVQLAQAWFLQKNQMLQNGFLIFVTQRWHKASVACKNQSF